MNVDDLIEDFFNRGFPIDVATSMSIDIAMEMEMAEKEIEENKND